MVCKVNLLFKRIGFEIKNRKISKQKNIRDSDVMTAVILHPSSDVFLPADLIPVAQGAFRTNRGLDKISR